MSRTDQTVNVRMSEELIQQVEECLYERGFSNRSEFIRSAVRDALEKENPYTEQAREEIEQARKAYQQNQGDNIDSLLEGVGLDSLSNEDTKQNETGFAPSLFDEEQDTWTDETDVTIVGLGGAGARLVTRLHSKDLEQADTVVIDTEEATLDDTVANTRLHVQLGNGNSDSEIDESEMIARIMEESREKLAEQLFSSTDLVFIVSGIGGSAGTTLTPIVSHAAQEAGAVVTTISTLPHTLEQDRRRRARDDIQLFKDRADTFVLIDAARFAEFTPDLAPGQVFEMINEYLVTALRQMVWHREYLGEVNDDNEGTGLASFFRNGGYATFATGSASKSSELETIRENLYARSLVDMSSKTTGNLMHLVRVNPDKFTDDEVQRLLHILFKEPSNIIPANVNINLVEDRSIEDAFRLTSIITGLEISANEIIDVSASNESETSKGGLVVKTDNTSAEGVQTISAPTSRKSSTGQTKGGITIES